MELTINDEQKVVDEKNLSITALLAINNVESPDMVSVQLNGQIVERQFYDTTMLADRDEVDFLYFMGGGALT